MKTQPKHTATSKSADTIKIWTIGHSNRSKQAFLELLEKHEIKVLADAHRGYKSQFLGLLLY